MPYPYSYDDEIKETAPRKLQTDRNMWKLVLLDIVTLGLYSVFFFIPFASDLDKIAPDQYHRKTMGYLPAYILSLFTLSLVLVFWFHEISMRVEEALSRRNIDYEFTTGTYWIFYFCGPLMLIGRFIYFHKLCTAMNLLCEDYNKNPTVGE